MAIDRVDLTAPRDPFQPGDPRNLRSVQIAVFAKPPIPGLAKTRLIPALGAAGAARLQRQFTRRAVDTAKQADLGAVTLWCAPQVSHRFFRAMTRTTGVARMAQANGDLGERMHTAFRLHAIKGPLIVIGTDCPALRTAHLRRAAHALVNGADVVMQPAEDGGYVMIGLRRPQALLFRQMPWSTDRVAHETRARAADAPLSMRELEPLWDVDVPEDLPRLRVLLAEVPDLIAPVEATNA